MKYCGSLPKLQQMCAIEVFSTKCSRVMVASDAAARGLDLPDVKLVVCYDVPDHFETYVHRVGRTARAGATGIAITVCSHSERPHLQALLNMLERKMIQFTLKPGIFWRQGYQWNSWLKLKELLNTTLIDSKFQL